MGKTKISQHTGMSDMQVEQDFIALNQSIGGDVPATRTITGENGLTGGGDLSGDIIISGVDADETNKGVAPLYNSLGTNTDGPVNQSFFSTELNSKVNITSLTDDSINEIKANKFSAFDDTENGSFRLETNKVLRKSETVANVVDIGNHVFIPTILTKDIDGKVFVDDSANPDNRLIKKSELDTKINISDIASDTDFTNKTAGKVLDVVRISSDILNESSPTLTVATIEATVAYVANQVAGGVTYRGLMTAGADFTTNTTGNSYADANSSYLHGDMFVVSGDGILSFSDGDLNVTNGDAIIIDKDVADASIVVADAGQIETSAVVTSVHGRTGAVVSANGDYDASQVNNVPSGKITATNIQDAINEIDSEISALDSSIALKSNVPTLFTENQLGKFDSAGHSINSGIAVDADSRIPADSVAYITDNSDPQNPIKTALQTYIDNLKKESDRLNPLYTVYVSQNTDTYTATGSKQYPFKTIQDAINSTNLTNGTTIKVLGTHTYAETITFRNGELNKKILIENTNTEITGDILIPLNAQSIYFEGGSISSNITVSNQYTSYFRSDLSGSFFTFNNVNATTGYCEIEGITLDSVNISLQGNAIVDIYGRGQLGTLDQDAGMLRVFANCSINSLNISGSNIFTYLDWTVSLVKDVNNKSLICSATSGGVFSKATTLQSDLTSYGMLDFSTAGASLLFKDWKNDIGSDTIHSFPTLHQVVYATKEYVDNEIANIPANGDYTASQVGNVPAGTLTSTTVQDALNEIVERQRNSFQCGTAVSNEDGDETFLFPRAFPEGSVINVSVTRTEANAYYSLPVTSTSPTGFVINRENAVSSPAPFMWQAMNETLIME